MFVAELLKVPFPFVRLLQIRLWDRLKPWPLYLIHNSLWTRKLWFWKC